MRRADAFGIVRSTAKLGRFSAYAQENHPGPGRRIGLFDDEDAAVEALLRWASEREWIGRMLVLALGCRGREQLHVLADVVLSSDVA